MTVLTVGSLCTGFDGLGAGLELAGWPVERAWFSETDADASAVLAQHWPTVPNLGDMTRVDWSMHPRVDVITAGIPCQGHSLAGQRRGRSDERNLWPDTARCLAALLPEWFLLENVPGLLTSDGDVFGEILADLDRLGYVTAWTTLGACKVGACHHRHRLFLLARRTAGDARRRNVAPAAPLATLAGGTWRPPHRDLFGDYEPVTWPTAGLVADGQVWPRPCDPCGAPVVRATKPLDDPEGFLFDDIESCRAESLMLPTPTATEYGNNQSASPGAAVRQSLQALARLELLPTPTARIAGKRGTPSVETAAHRIFVERRRNLEDAVALLPTPTARDSERGAGRTYAEGRPLSEVIALLPTPLASDHDGGPGRHNDRGKPNLTAAMVGLLPTPRASDAEKGGPNQRGSSGDVALPATVQPGRFGAYESAVRRHEAALGIVAPEPTELGRLGRPRLSARFPEFMMGLPAGFLADHVGRKAAIRMAGNGAMPQAVAAAVAALATTLAAVAAEEVEVPR